MLLICELELEDDGVIVVPRKTTPNNRKVVDTNVIAKRNDEELTQCFDFIISGYLMKGIKIFFCTVLLYNDNRIITF